MRAVVLNGSHGMDGILDSIDSIIKKEIEDRGWECISFKLREITISSCRGCFGCWVKTPGICVVDDPARDIAKNIIQSDLVVFLTPVTFGGYSSELKKALDRMICLISPFFKRINREVHHEPRYKCFPFLLALGTMQDQVDNHEEERIFKTLVERNAVNMHSPVHVADIIPREYDSGEIRKKIDLMLNDMGILK